MPIDIEVPPALAQYLRARGHLGPDEHATMTILAGGVSNRTVLVERESPGASSWVIKQALPKLRVDVDWYSDPARIHREAAGLRRLQEILPDGSVPAFVFEDSEHHLLAMEAVPQPHKNWKTCLLAGQVEDGHVTQFAEMLAAIHRGSVERQSELAPEFADRSFFESLRLEPYYAYAATQVPGAADFLDGLIGETLGHREALVHGDFSPKNILVPQGRLVLLDHEVIHWGDPAFDIGFSMTHLLSKAHHVRARRAAFARAARLYWNSYADAIGPEVCQRDLEQRCVRHTLGCLLARVAGRSPLEYLSDDERRQQRRLTTELSADIPVTMDELVARFMKGLDCCACH